MLINKMKIFLISLILKICFMSHFSKYKLKLYDYYEVIGSFISYFDLTCEIDRDAFKKFQTDY